MMLLTSPSASLRLLHARAKASSRDLRVCLSFFLFGMVNNVFYVIILTAALDLVGPSIPKATVLLACILPGLATKVVAPYTIQYIPYAFRTVLFALLSSCGMLAVALSPHSTNATSISGKLAGIVVANISSGAGEVNFLSLTHYYGPMSLAAWGSGTGGAGLIGAGVYTLATTTLGFTVHATLLSSTALSLILLASYFIVLPLEPLRAARQKHVKYEPLDADDGDLGATNASESAGLLSRPASRSVSPAYKQRTGWVRGALRDLRANCSRTRSLVVPFMLPLFLVYLAEYTINQGVAPTLLFPLEESPFKHYRAFYPTYGTIYQLGVLISRSSLPFIRVRTLYLPTLLQVLNLLALTAHALYPFIPTVWFVFAIVLWEGLLGGLVYVSTFAAIREEVPEEEREFSLGTVTMSDSGGIFVAGLLGSIMETTLCNWQVSHGRDWCKKL